MTKRQKQWAERLYPSGMAIALTVGTYLLVGSAPLRMIAQDLASPILNVWAILVGFLATALSILLTAQSLPALERLKETKQFALLVDYNWAALRWGFFAVLASLFFVVKTPFAFVTAESAWLRIGVIGFFATQFLASFSFYRALSLFKFLLTG